MMTNNNKYSKNHGRNRRTKRRETSNENDNRNLKQIKIKYAKFSSTQWIGKQIETQRWDC